jgi:hypothetical protein
MESHTVKIWIIGSLPNSKKANCAMGSNYFNLAETREVKTPLCILSPNVMKFIVLLQQIP